MMDLAWMRGTRDVGRCHEWRFQNFEATIMKDEDLDEIYNELFQK
jgi:hypothetical protein